MIKYDEQAIQVLCTTHVAILQMASNVHGEVDEVREKRLRRSESDRLRRERETSKENSIEYMNILLIQSAGQHQEIMLCQDV